MLAWTVLEFHADRASAFTIALHQRFTSIIEHTGCSFMLTYQEPIYVSAQLIIGSNGSILLCHRRFIIGIWAPKGMHLSHTTAGTFICDWNFIQFLHWLIAMLDTTHLTIEKWKQCTKEVIRFTMAPTSMPVLVSPITGLEKKKLKGDRPHAENSYKWRAGKGKGKEKVSFKRISQLKSRICQHVRAPLQLPYETTSTLAAETPCGR